MIKHITIRVSGKVQGVFYRASARDKAIELGIKGFVRNELDGSVYIEAEGDEVQHNELVNLCKQEPPHSKLADVIVTEENVVGLEKFDIER